MEREELEMIMVRPVPLGRAWAAISGLAGIVRHLGPDPLARRDRARRGRNVIGAPVTVGAAGRIGIVDHQREALGAGRRLIPAERRRLVGAVARILRRNRLPVLEGVAGQAELAERGVFHLW